MNMSLWFYIPMMQIMLWSVVNTIKYYHFYTHLPLRMAVPFSDHKNLKVTSWHEIFIRILYTTDQSPFLLSFFVDASGCCFGVPTQWYDKCVPLCAHDCHTV